MRKSPTTRTRTKAAPKAPSAAEIARQYCLDVTEGRKIANKRERQACARHLRDLERQADPAWPYLFDEEKAEKAVKRARSFPHVKGAWARASAEHPHGNPIKWEPWQIFILCSLFGWVKKANGFRRFRYASIYIPRKNAKSTLAAVIGWLLFAFDGEPGAEVYSGATSEKQAWEVFGTARQMGVIDTRLPEARGVTMNARSMVRVADGSKFEPIIGKPGDGSSPHGAIIDEYHEHSTSVSYDTMRTGMGARQQPLLLAISTAGDLIQGPCRDDWKTVEQILGGVIEDETHFGIIYTIDDDDDWTSEDALRKANPNYDVSVSADFLRGELEKAKRDAGMQGIFKTKHLNVWVSAKAAFYNMEQWRKCAVPSLKLADFASKSCFLGIDLAAKIDLAGFSALFPVDDRRAALFGKFYIPEAMVNLPENRHYQKWRTEGRIVVTDGNMTDLTRLRADVIAFCKAHNVREVRYDPDGATLLVQDLTAEGISCVEVTQTMANLSDPMKQIEAMIKGGALMHDGDPVFEYAFSNVVAKRDNGDRVLPTKERPQNKIDPAATSIMAVGAWLSAGPEPVAPGFFFVK